MKKLFEKDPNTLMPILLDTYRDKGLTPELLNKLIQSEPFTKNHFSAINYLFKKTDNADEVISKLQEYKSADLYLNNDQVFALDPVNCGSRGLTQEHLWDFNKKSNESDSKKRFQVPHRKALEHLLEHEALDKAVEIAANFTASQLKLNKEEEFALDPVNCGNLGLTKEHLWDFNKNSTNEFSTHHGEALEYLLKQEKVESNEIIEQLKGYNENDLTLTTAQNIAVDLFHDHGVTKEHLWDFNKNSSEEFTMAHLNALERLIQQNTKLEEAMEQLINTTEEQVSNIGKGEDSSFTPTTL